MDVMGVSEVLLYPYRYLEYINSKNSKFNSASTPVPDNSASQSYLSSCDAECLSSLFLNELAKGTVTTEKGRLRLNIWFIITLNSTNNYQQTIVTQKIYEMHTSIK